MVNGGGTALAGRDGGGPVFLQTGAIQIFGDGLMRGWLAGQDEIAADVLDRGGDGLAGEEIVTWEYRPEGLHGGPVPGQPAFRGIPFAILLLRPILVCDEFRRQRQDLLMAGGHDAGAKEGMEIFGAAIGTFPHGTAPAVDLTRAEVFGPIQRDQYPAVQAPERVEHASGFDGPEEQRIERARGGAIEHLADMGIGWDFVDPEQGLAVRPAMPFFQPSLMVQERRASHEEQRKRRQSDVGHGVFAGAAGRFAPVRKTGADAAQRRDQGFKGGHGCIESKDQPRRQAESSNVAGKTNEIRAV